MQSRVRNPPIKLTVDHTFVIPAYGAVPHLAVLIESLRAQTQSGSQVVLTTSTPSTAIEKLAQHYGVPLRVNPRRVDIAADWNFAYDSARTALVTIAHQDDLYEPGYVAQTSAALGRHPEALIAFCDYCEHTPSGRREPNINLRIKRALCHRGFGAREAVTLTRDKRRFLSLGNPICCPSVMFRRALLPAFHFPPGFQTNLDWAAWLELARIEGGFVYVREVLVSKGIHAGSETTATIANRARAREDRALFEAFWPEPVAAALATVYQLGYRGNRVLDVKRGRD